MARIQGSLKRSPTRTTLVLLGFLDVIVGVAGGVAGEIAASRFGAAAFAGAADGGFAGLALTRELVAGGTSTGSAFGTPCQKPRSVMTSFAVALPESDTVVACARRTGLNSAEVNS